MGLSRKPVASTAPDPGGHCSALLQLTQGWGCVMPAWWTSFSRLPGHTLAWRPSSLSALPSLLGCSLSPLG